MDTQPIYTASDVERHVSKGDCWIVRAGRVYNVTGFLDDHPGGNDLILRHAGKDVSDAMTDPSGHDHSQAAYDILNQYAVGKVGATPALVNDDWVVTDHFHPNETSPDDDYKKNEFLDLNKPLIRQIWESSFSKEFYLQQVHQPRHVSKTARCFGPDYLEFFTRTEWYMVPIVWLPIAISIFIRSALQFSGAAPHSVLVWASFAVDSITAISLAKTTALFFVGLFLWTLFEYLHHRYLFHLDRLLPDTPGFLTAHFIVHGIHHFLPMDRLRLVLPPIMFFVLQFPVTRLLYALFSPAITNGLVSGLFVAYVIYDCMHYHLHHTYLPGYIREMKRYHLSHHYKNTDLGFGITTKLWDYVFNTVIV